MILLRMVLLPFAFLSILRLQSKVAVLAVGIVILGFALTRLFRSRAPNPPACALMGACVPLLAWIEPGALLATGLSFLCFALNAGVAGSLGWALPLYFVMGCWVASEVVLDFDALSVVLIYSGGDGPGAGIMSIMEWLRISPPASVLVIEVLLRFLMMISFFGLLSSDPESRAGFKSGLIAGLVPAAMMTLLQVCGFLSSMFPNQTEYWNMQGRYSGTFSDPNSFGVFTLLALALLLEHSRRAANLRRYDVLLLAGILAVLALFSGSRSYVAGLFIYALMYLWTRGRGKFFAGIACALAGVLVLNMAMIFIPSAYGLLTAAAPVGLSRVLETLNFASIYEAWFSRIVFYKIGLEMWLDNPLLGAGLGSFRSLVPPYADSLGIDTGLWTDNANNFYIGTLAETGLAGFAALLASLFNLRWVENGSGILRRALCCFLVLLLLGPHLDFNEVSILVALLMSDTLRGLQTSRFRPGLAAVAAAYAFIVFVRVDRGEHGLYAWEKDARGSYFRWTSREARAAFSCAGRDILTIRIAAHHPDSAMYPLQVSLRSPFSGQEILNFDSPGVHELEMKCGPDSSDGTRAVAADVLMLDLVTSRIWTPRKYGIGRDSRPLGVQVQYERPALSLPGPLKR